MLGFLVYCLNARVAAVTPDCGQMLAYVHLTPSTGLGPVARGRWIHSSKHALDGYRRLPWMSTSVSVHSRIRRSRTCYGLSLRLVLCPVRSRPHAVGLDGGLVKDNVGHKGTSIGWGIQFGDNVEKF